MLKKVVKIGCAFMLVSIAGIIATVWLVFFRPTPLKGDLRYDTAVLLVDWIVHGQKLPGYKNDYGAFWKDMVAIKSKFFVTCDFVPQEMSLSNDPRVIRIKREELDRVFDKYEYGKGRYDYLELKFESEDAEKIVVCLSNMYGYAGGHGYRFTFIKKHDRIYVVKGEFLWVS